MANKIEQFWPMVQYLVKNKALIPALIVVGTGAGYSFGYFVGNTMAIVAVGAGVVFYAIRQLVTEKKG